jgi:colanic acid biosynthesis protein WcaH
MITDWLQAESFSQSCSALPLISLDLCLTRPSSQGPELLLGLRNNRPAQGVWITPGGRIPRTSGCDGG